MKLAFTTDPNETDQQIPTEPPTFLDLNNDTTLFNYSLTQTVGVLKRIKDGRVLEFVLLRDNPRQVGGDEARATDILKHAVLFPGDHYSVDVLQRQPLILASMAAPHLFKPVQPDSQCLPRVHDTWQDAIGIVHGLFGPPMQLINDVGGLVTQPMQNVGDALLTPLRR
jgi:hypothetical protein